jgi:hypothetical protein
VATRDARGTEGLDEQDSKSSVTSRQSGEQVSPILGLASPADDDSEQESETATSEDIPLKAAARKIRMTALPDYSPYLPPFDRTKVGEDFFADLCDKRVIPGFDEERFSCWCHVAKRAENPDKDLILSKMHVSTKKGVITRFQSSRWLEHAAKCSFYKVSTVALRHSRR